MWEETHQQAAPAQNLQPGQKHGDLTCSSIRIAIGTTLIVQGQTWPPAALAEDKERKVSSNFQDIHSNISDCVAENNQGSKTKLTCIASAIIVVHASVQNIYGRRGTSLGRCPALAATYSTDRKAAA